MAGMNCSTKAKGEAGLAPRVAFLVRLDSGFGRDIARGVAAYADRHGPWRITWDFMLDISMPDPDPRRDTLADVDGIITPFYNDTMAHRIRAAKRPTVVVGSYNIAEGMPAVMTDEPKIGRMVAEHFLAQGFESFAYYHLETHKRLVGRMRGFCDCIEAAGYDVPVVVCERAINSAFKWRQHRDHLTRWLAELPKPVGVMAINDMLGRCIVEACHEARLRIPEDVAVIGVDNDTALCSLCSPPLSSVAHGAEQIGYRGAELLDQLMAGKQPPTEPILVPPAQLNERQSSDLLAVGDPTVAAAIRYIREHVADGLQVGDVVDEVLISRTALENAFRRRMNRTIYEEIVRVQIARAKQLLVSTDLSMPRVADHSGFKYASHLSASFKRHTGMTCTAYRRRHRMT